MIASYPLSDNRFFFCLWKGKKDSQKRCPLREKNIKKINGCYDTSVVNEERRCDTPGGTVAVKERKIPENFLLYFLRTGN